MRQADGLHTKDDWPRILHFSMTDREHHLHVSDTGDAAGPKKKMARELKHLIDQKPD